MKAVSNTTPLRYLIAIEQEHLLGQLFEKVFVPVAVHEELTDSRTPETVRRRVLALPAWFEVRTVQESQKTRFPVTLHRGEREAILLAETLHADDSAQQHLGAKTENVRHLAELFRKLDTDQSEIVATLYACWNDLLLRKRKAADEDIVNEFVYHWHPKKARFPKRRLLNALKWMRENNLTPKGLGKPTAAKPGTTS